MNGRGKRSISVYASPWHIPWDFRDSFVLISTPRAQTIGSSRSEMESLRISGCVFLGNSQLFPCLFQGNYSSNTDAEKSFEAHLYAVILVLVNVILGCFVVAISEWRRQPFVLFLKSFHKNLSSFPSCPGARAPDTLYAMLFRLERAILER